MAGFLDQRAGAIGPVGALVADEEGDAPGLTRDIDRASAAERSETRREAVASAHGNRKGPPCPVACPNRSARAPVVKPQPPLCGEDGIRRTPVAQDGRSELKALP